MAVYLLVKQKKSYEQLPDVWMMMCDVDPYFGARSHLLVMLGSPKQISMFIRSLKTMHQAKNYQNRWVRS